MESQMQSRYDAWDDKINSLAPFMDDLATIIEQHGVDKEDIELAVKYMGIK